MLKTLEFQYRNFEEPNWEEVNKEWSVIFGNNSNFIVFPEFLTTLKQNFAQKTNEFVKCMDMAKCIKPEIPNNFPDLPVLEKCKIFFSFLRRVFNFKDISNFVCKFDLSPKSFKKSFSSAQNVIFNSIAFIYKEMMNCIVEKNRNEYEHQIITILSRLMIPDECKFFFNKEFELETLFITPGIYHTDSVDKLESFFEITNKKELVIINAKDNSIVATIKTEKVSVIREECTIEVYNDLSSPFMTLTLQDEDKANILINFILNPPPKGFNQLLSFMHSINCFKKSGNFCNQAKERLPDNFTKSLNKIIKSEGCELLLYSIMDSESLITSSNALIFANYLDDKLIPFLRAAFELSLYQISDGSTLLRTNDPLNYLILALFKVTSSTYLDNVIKSLTTVLKGGIGLLKDPINSYEDANLFCQKVFQPAVNVILNSVDDMDPFMKYMLRMLMIRTESHFNGEIGTNYVIPNLLLSRLITPEFTRQNSDHIKYASTLCLSLLSLFSMSGWPSNYKYLSKIEWAMDSNFPKVKDFNQKILNCNSASMPKIQFKDNISIFDLFSTTAFKLPQLKLSLSNELIDSHIYSVSMMQAFEEYIYDL